MKRCERCGSPEVSSHHRAKYCDGCQAAVKKDKNKRAYLNRVAREHQHLLEEKRLLQEKNMKKKIDPYWLVRGPISTTSSGYSCITGAGTTL